MKENNSLLRNNYFHYFILVAVLCSKELEFNPQTDALITNLSKCAVGIFSNRRDSALLQTDRHQYPECTCRADICHTGDLWKSPSPPSAASHWSYSWHSKVLITTFNLSSRRLGFDERPVDGADSGGKVCLQFSHEALRQTLNTRLFCCLQHRNNKTIISILWMDGIQ